MERPLPLLRPEGRAFTIFLGLLATLPMLSIDISTPTLPLLPAALGTTVTTAGLTISLFMVGFAGGQLIAGPRSDRAGRRPVLLLALGLYVVAGLGCTLAVSGPMLVTTRLLQGLGAGACAVLSLAIVQDLFQGEVARIKRSYVVIVVAVTPILAPAFGSFLTELAGWRSVHAVLVLGGCVLALTTWAAFEESRAADAALARRGFGHLLKDGPFLGIALTNALSYAAIFAYIAGSPLVILSVWQYPAMVFPAVFAATAIALSCGAWVSGRMAHRGVSAAILVRLSLLAQTIAGILLAAGVITDLVPRAALLIPLLIVLFTRGVIAPNLQHLAIERGGDQAGVASAGLGVSQLLAGAAASALAACLLPSFGAGAVGTPIAALACAALLSWIWAAWIVRQREKPNPLSVTD